MKLIGTGTNGGSIFSVDPVAKTKEILVDFSSPGSPKGRVALIDGKLWGTVGRGILTISPNNHAGKFGHGSLYRVDPNGENFEIVHEFDGINGSGPTGYLLEHEGKIYGIANGTNVDRGLIYTIDKDGSNFTVIHRWDDIVGGSRWPEGGLIFANNKLWGTTSTLPGNIFSIGIDGNNYNVEHSFSQETGTKPVSNLIYHGGKLWGMTTEGGTSDMGVVFSINEDGSNYTVLHEFSGTDGDTPRGNLIVANSKIYGATTSGGNSNVGVLFTLDLDGTNYTKIVDFGSGLTTPKFIVSFGGKIWGDVFATFEDGLFSVNFDGSGLTQSFDYPTNQFYQTEELFVKNDSLIVITTQGGTSGVGTIYSTNANGDYNLIKDFDRSQGDFPFSNVVLGDGKLYGVTRNGGTDNSGVIYSLELDGTGYEVLYQLIGSGVATSEVGSSINGSPLFLDSILLGVSPQGVFDFDLQTKDYRNIKYFLGGSDGSAGRESLTAVNDEYWGITERGGSSGKGIIFSVGLEGAISYQTRYEFTESDGIPRGDLTLIESKLWGRTSGGGSNNSGIIFNIDTSGTNFTIVHNFEQANGSVGNQSGKLIPLRSKLWGVTQRGGANEFGIIFSIDTTGTFQKLHDFDSLNGRYPIGGLTQIGSKFYGTTNSGGLNDDGIIFSIDTIGTNFEKVLDLSGESGNPASTLIAIKDSQLIAFELSDKSYGDDPFELSATSNSSSPIAYSSSNESIIKVSGSTATIVGVGSVTLTASQPEDNNYFAGTKSITIDVKPIPIVLEVANASKTYGSDDPEFTYTIKSGNLLEGDEINGELSRTEGELVGQYDMQIGNLSAGNKYDISIESSTFTISAAGITATAVDRSRKFGEDNPAFTASYSGFVNGEDESVLTKQPTFSSTATKDSDAGEYTIDISGAEAPNYAISYTSGSLTIDKADQSITFNSLGTRTTGDDDFNLEATASSGLGVSYSTADDLITISGNTVTINSAGTATITASQGGNTNYNPAANVTQTLVIEEVQVPLGITGFDNIEVIPNPVKSTFSIPGNLEYSSLTLYDLKGIKIKEFGKMDIYNIRSLSNGTYQVLLQGIGNPRVFKIIKE